MFSKYLNISSFRWIASLATVTCHIRGRDNIVPGKHSRVTCATQSTWRHSWRMNIVDKRLLHTTSAATSSVDTSAVEMINFGSSFVHPTHACGYLNDSSGNLSIIGVPRFHNTDRCSSCYMHCMHAPTKKKTKKNTTDKSNQPRRSPRRRLTGVAKHEWLTYFFFQYCQLL